MSFSGLHISEEGKAEREGSSGEAGDTGQEGVTRKRIWNYQSLNTAVLNKFSCVGCAASPCPGVRYRSDTYTYLGQRQVLYALLVNEWLQRNTANLTALGEQQLPKLCLGWTAKQWLVDGDKMYHGFWEAFLIGLWYVIREEEKLRWENNMVSSKT